MNREMEWLGRTLVVAPHPDDEVLGAGGTMAKLSESGQEVFVVVVTKGKPPAYSAEFVARVRAEAKSAHDLLGVKETFWLDQPAAELPEVRNVVLNGAIGEVVQRIAPQTILRHFQVTSMLIINSYFSQSWWPRVHIKRPIRKRSWPMKRFLKLIGMRPISHRHSCPTYTWT